MISYIAGVASGSAVLTFDLLGQIRVSPVALPTSPWIRPFSLLRDETQRDAVLPRSRPDGRLTALQLCGNLARPRSGLCHGLKPPVLFSGPFIDNRIARLHRPCRGKNKQQRVECGQEAAFTFVRSAGRSSGKSDEARLNRRRTAGSRWRAAVGCKGRLRRRSKQA